MSHIKLTPLPGSQLPREIVLIPADVLRQCVLTEIPFLQERDEDPPSITAITGPWTGEVLEPPWEILRLLNTPRTPQVGDPDEVYAAAGFVFQTWTQNLDREGAPQNDPHASPWTPRGFHVTPTDTREYSTENVRVVWGRWARL